MALQGLEDKFLDLKLDEPEYLLFEPTGDLAWLQQKFDDIPRYLFRIFSPKFDGTTDKCWVNSKDAANDRSNSSEDIFARGHGQTASMLYRHLKWISDLDNLVSWTSSLLFALQYIFYRHSHWKDQSSLDDCFLCVVDTDRLPKGVFLRDMDLICAYHASHSGLEDLHGLRTRKHDKFKGSFYFGEYLSQGALKIENKCQIVSAREIVNRKLYRLQPAFETKGQVGLANEVIRLREAYYQEPIDSQQISEEGLQAAINIAQLFEPGWRLPVAVSFTALFPSQRAYGPILRAFQATSFTGSPLPVIVQPSLTDTDDERKDCSPSTTRVMAYETLPEVQRFDELMRGVYGQFCLDKIKDHIGEAVTQLCNAGVIYLDQRQEAERSSQAPPLADDGCKAVLRRVHSIMLLSQRLQQDLRSSYREEFASTRSPYLARTQCLRVCSCDAKEET